MTEYYVTTLARKSALNVRYLTLKLYVDVRPITRWSMVQNNKL